MLKSVLRLRGLESNAPDAYAEAFYCRKLVLDVAGPPPRADGRRNVAGRRTVGRDGRRGGRRDA